MKTILHTSLTLTTLCFLCLSPLGAQVLLDEDFQEWGSVSTQYADAQGDATGLDLLSLSASSNAEYLFLKIELDREINLQDNNALTLLLDTDNNSNTGSSTSGIGADLSYTFG